MGIGLGMEGGERGRIGGMGDMDGEEGGDGEAEVEGGGIGVGAIERMLSGIMIMMWKKSGRTHGCYDISLLYFSSP